MKNPIEIELTMTVKDADGRTCSRTVQSYANLDDDQALMIEKAVVGSLMGLGDAGSAKRGGAKA